MAERMYGHYCGLAYALDLVGERWSLLLVRELLTGPKRNRDLIQRLPGLGSTVLAKRLKHLTKHGLIRLERQPPPSSANAYVLTEKARALEPLLIALAQWGLAHLGPEENLMHVAPGAAILAMQANIESDAFAGIDEVYEVRISSDVFHLRTNQGMPISALGPAPHADCILRADSDTFSAILSGQVAAASAARQGLLRLSGKPDARHRCLALLDFAPLRQGSRLPMVDLTGSRLRRMARSPAEDASRSW